MNFRLFRVPCCSCWNHGIRADPEVPHTDTDAHSVAIELQSGIMHSESDCVRHLSLAPRHLTCRSRCHHSSQSFPRAAGCQAVDRWLRCVARMYTVPNTSVSIQASYDIIDARVFLSPGSSPSLDLAARRRIPLPFCP